MKPRDRGFALRAGAAKVDITPPLDVGILMSSANRQWAPFKFVRAPLMCRVLLLQQDKSRVAIVSLDLLGLAKNAAGTWPRFLARIAAAAPIRPDQLIIASTHTHNGPETLDLTDLYRTAAFRRWTGGLPEKIAAAIREAHAALRPCDLAWSSDPGADLTLHRRILTTRGIVLSNVPPDPKIVLREGGPKDETVRIVLVRELGPRHRPIAILVNATCHPVHEMCEPHISPDYPGEMCVRIERSAPGSVCLFLNGAAGNINPKRVSDGAQGSIVHGQKLAQIVHAPLKHPTLTSPIPPAELRLKHARLRLPTRTRTGKPSSKTLTLELTALGIGPVALLCLPGEPFVETALQLLKHSPFPFTLIAGYCAEWTGYLPPRAAFAEGGYEIGPGDWCRLRVGAAEDVARCAKKLLGRV